MLLLNTCLTVEAGKAGSHAGQGWEASPMPSSPRSPRGDEPTVFILWGNHAQAKAARMPACRSGGRHLVLKRPHPSPLSAYRGFFG